MIEFLNLILYRLIEIIYAPFHYPAMFWIIFPLASTVILMEMYFGRYPREEMGYHAALENAVFLLFVAVDLVRHLLLHHDGSTSTKVGFIAFIIIYALVMIILDFYHKLPRNIAFRTSSKTLIGFTAYICIVLVYSNILMSITPQEVFATAIAVLVTFIIFRTVIGFIKFMQPPAKDELDDLLQDVEKELRAAAKEASELSKP